MSEFASEVEKLKWWHLDNIRTLVGNSMTDKQLGQFFLENWGITPQSLRKLLANEIARTNKSNDAAKIWLIVEKFIPDTEKIDIPKLWVQLAESIDPNSNPTQVAEAIAKYIQSQMQYDAMTAIITVLPKFDLQKQDITMPKDEGKLLRSIRENPNIQINEHSRQEWINKLQERSKTVKDPEQRWIIEWIINALWKRDGNEVTRITKILAQVKNPFVLFEIGVFLSKTAISIPDNMSSNEVTGLKNWVCRHYSLIAKNLYEEIKKNFPWNTELQDSELLYVLNPWMQHAYNLLVYKNPFWKIEKRYIDITDLIIKNELYPKNRKWEQEILAQWNEQSSYNNIW